ncbi:unnamed protein product [Rhizophagus irregularis]|nr:unnamed protein product [Rhizophagus irregularis]
MEDKRNIQIAENKFPLIEGEEQQIFLRTTYINYLNFSEGLAAQFFTGRNIEVQRNILRENFGLTDEDINSWESRATRYQMTSESFAFFLHTAMYSAAEGFAAAERFTAERRNMLATSIAEHVTSMDEKQQKIEEKIEKAKKRSEDRASKKNKTKTGKNKSKKDKKKKRSRHQDSDSDFTNQYGEFLYEYGSDSDDLLDQTITELMDKAADEMIPKDQPFIDLIKSGINLDNSTNVDQSSKMEIITDTPGMTQIDITPKLQATPQSQNIITDSTKSSNKKKKSNKNLVQKAITGHTPTDKAKGERKFIGYFEKWVDMRTALDNHYTWEQINLSWNRHVPPKQPTRSQGNNTNKNHRTSRSQQTQNQQNSLKNSKKKPQETKSDKKSKKDKKDKSRKASRSKVLAEIIDVLRKLI